MNKTNILVIVASLFIILAGFKLSSTILIPILLAAFITIILTPLITYLSSKMHKVFVYITVIGLLVLSIGIFSKVVTNSINSFRTNLPHYQSQLTLKAKPIEGTLATYGIDLNSIGALEEINPKSLLQYSLKMLKSISDLLGNITTIILLVVFMLLEVELFKEKMNKIFDDEETHKKLDSVMEKISKYFIIKVKYSALTGVIIYIGLLLLGVDNAVLWAMLAFGLNFIPTIGSIIAAIPAILITFVQFDMSIVFVVIALYLSVNIIVGSVLEPKAMGSGLGISTLVVFLSLLFWGYIFGMVGMFLSVPLTIVIKIILDENEKTKKLGILLSD